MRSIPAEYEILLPRVEKPGRYIGGEMNAIAKDPSGLRATIALAFPDIYDIGMSYHGFRILYEIVNARSDFAAERVFAPWVDFARELRNAQLPLTTLETFRALTDVEIVGFTLQHELCYTNVLEMLDLGGIPLRSADRSETFPLVIAGGEGAYSPEPMADFIDAFAVGDGEEVVIDLLETAARAREAGASRSDLLKGIAAIPGVYVPAFYEVAYKPDGAIESIRPIDGLAPPVVAPRVYDISKDLGPVRPVVPLIRTVQDRTVVEIRRGCVNGCRFCQAGMIGRPVRERSVAQALEAVRQSIANTGDDSVSLLSLSTADYTEIRELVGRLTEELSPRRISVSLPSLRISAFDVELAGKVSAVRKCGLTFAPEAGSERLRRIINKPLDEAEFLDVIGETYRAGWRTIKMYFMIGLPGETDEDLDGVIRIAQAAVGRARELGVRKVQVNVTLSPFVPKAHTPFQWEGQAGRDEIVRRMNCVRDGLRSKRISIKTSSVDATILEAVMARGDRRLGRVIERAWRNGSRFDSWREGFRPEIWREAFAACDLDPAWYAERPRGEEEIFPYDHIASGPGKRFLAEQRDKARAGETTPDCVNNPCARCDACEKPKAHTLARDVLWAAGGALPEEERAPKARKSAAQGKTSAASDAACRSSLGQIVMRARLRFTKGGSLRYIAHLELATLIHRLVRRSGAPLAHTQGFNPQPRIALSPPLPLGFEGLGEIADVWLLERVDLLDWLRSLVPPSPDGLEWTGAEEVGLREPSIQQAVTQFEYHLWWRPACLRATHRQAGQEAPALPLDRDALDE
ncbi:MAG TPA: TIGR03960 family B12-binding radical SAM protein, partial [Sumerlaeia bacterium]|nr:TIGR03960 family B12-binding radical SAM protein [Sumerlaeia bacterium]